MRHSQFEAVVRRAIESLPDWAREKLREIDVIVADEPEDDLDPDLLGVYIGVPLTERSFDYTGDLSDVIYIFRLPHLELGLSKTELRKEIQKTLIHEVAHYFGIEEDRLDELGWG